MKKWLYTKVVCKILDRKMAKYTEGLTKCFINTINKTDLLIVCLSVGSSVIYSDYSLKSQYRAYRAISDFIETH